MLIGLILLIWLPLLLISVIGQASETNPPVEVDVKLSIGGFQVPHSSTWPAVKINSVCVHYINHLVGTSELAQKLSMPSLPCMQAYSIS